MPSLQELLTPSETVVLTVEMQRGVIGDQVTAFGGGALVEAVQKAGSIPAAQRLRARGPRCRSTRRACHHQPARRPGRASRVTTA